MQNVRLFNGDCRDVLATLDADSVDAVVCDPPYELAFMNKGWDNAGVSFDAETWRAAYRVLKPGGHLLAFGGTRTVHRIAVAIEDAGFEIRDQIVWMYGSGFPKSLDVSKAMDKQRDDRDSIAAVVRFLESARQASGITRQQVEDHFGTVNIGQGFFTVTPGSTPRVPKLEQWRQLKDLLQFGDEIDAEVERLNRRKGTPGEAWLDRPITGTVQEWTDRSNYAITSADGYRRDIPATDLAKQYEGFGTALKPAHEPVIVARKPLVGTVAANVARYGTGALNIDGCRIGTDGAKKWSTPRGGIWKTDAAARADLVDSGIGRWPANVCLDADAAAMLDAQSGERKGGGPQSGKQYVDQPAGWSGGTNHIGCNGDGTRTVSGYTDTGGASRFFYVAKASRSERNAGLDGMPETLVNMSGGRTLNTSKDNGHGERVINARANHHPTVKPVALMRWLVRLVTPPNGIVCDPFLGSGTTGIAAVLEGFDFVGIEQDADYLEIARRRIAHWSQVAAVDRPAQLSLVAD